jgi:hypothetical protein
MAVFACRRCRSVITPSLRFGAPSLGDGEATVEQSRYFVDPQPSRQTFDGRTGELVGVTSANCVIVNPRDTLAVRWHDERGNWIGCCGPDGDPEKNLLCSSCRLPVGTLSADCWTALEVRLEPEAVEWVADSRALDAVGPEERPDWYDDLRGDPMATAEGEETADSGDGEDDQDDEEDLDDDRGLSSFTLCAGAGKVWIAGANAPLVVVVDATTTTIEDVIELPNADAGRRKQDRPRWSVPTIAFGAGAVWVTDVVEPGVFVIDAATHRLRGRVAIEATDPRAAGSSPSTEVAASDALVAVTGHGQGDVAVIEPQRLAVDHVVRAGRSLRGIAVDGTTVWVGDDADDTVRRVERESGVIAVTSIEGRPSSVGVGLGQIWVTASTNVIPMRSPLHRLEPETGNIVQTTRGEWSGDALCTDQHTVWLVDEFYEPAAGEQLTADKNEDEDEDEDEDWNSQSALIGLDPESLTPVRKVVVVGQVHEVVAEADRLWALTFSAADQAHVLVAVDTATGQQERVGLGHIDVSSYDPPPQPAPRLQDEEFFEAVRAAVELAISVDGEQCHVEFADLGRSPRLIVNVVEGTVGRSWRWDLELSAEPDRDVAAVERLAQVVGATFRPLWASRRRVPTSDGSSPQRLD